MEGILNRKIIHARIEIHQTVRSVTIVRCSGTHWPCCFLILLPAKCWEFCEPSQVWDLQLFAWEQKEMQVFLSNKDFTQWAHRLAPIVEGAYHVKALKEAEILHGWTLLVQKIEIEIEMSSERILCIITGQRNFVNSMYQWDGVP